MNWDAAYSNMDHVPGSAALPAQWAAEAAAYRASGVVVDEGIAYGPDRRHRLDLVWPDHTPRGLAVFVHGGYWMRLSKSDWTHLAEGARAMGWAMAIPSYRLAPDARVADITQDIRQAITCAADRVDGPIRLAGHSAGGHLVTRMACTDMDLLCFDRVTGILSISGLHDLRPLMRTRMNEVLRLDLPEARAESTAILDPVMGPPVTAWVGGGELPEFIRQARVLDMVWGGLGVDMALRIDGDHHHFSVLDGLRSPDSDISRAFVGAEV